MRAFILRFLFFIFLSHQICFALSFYDPFAVSINDSSGANPVINHYMKKIVAKARYENLMLQIDLEKLEKKPQTFEEVDEAICETKMNVREKWHLINYKDLEIKNASWFTDDDEGLYFNLKNNKFFLKIHNQILFFKVANIIAQAKRQKACILLNIRALKSKCRQFQLNHKYIIKFSSCS